LEARVETEVLAKPVFRVGADVLAWADVVERARATGDWEELEDQVRHGLAAEREASASEAEVEAAARAFRYARGLLAGDQLDAWLDAHGLTASSWHDYLARMVAREAAPEAVGGDENPGPYVWAEGICSGRLQRVAHDLAALVAVAPDAPLDLRDDAYRTFCAAAATDAAIDREIEANRLEWTRLRYDVVRFADEDSAAEAALCVRADGDTVADVALRVGVELESRHDWLDEVSPQLASRFLAADAGVLIGPVAVEADYVVCLLLEKTPPSVDDDDVRARAGGVVIARAVASRVNDRVIWLERF
jgi:hypothetical protein